MSHTTNLTADAVPTGIDQIYPHDHDQDGSGIFDEPEPGIKETIFL